MDEKIEIVNKLMQSMNNEDINLIYDIANRLSLNSNDNQKVYSQAHSNIINNTSIFKINIIDAVDAYCNRMQDEFNKSWLFSFGVLMQYWSEFVKQFGLVDKIDKTIDLIMRKYMLEVFDNSTTDKYIDYESVLSIEEMDTIREKIRDSINNDMKEILVNLFIESDLFKEAITAGNLNCSAVEVLISVLFANQKSLKIYDYFFTED